MVSRIARLHRGSVCSFQQEFSFSGMKLSFYGNSFHAKWSSRFFCKPQRATIQFNAIELDLMALFVSRCDIVFIFFLDSIQDTIDD